jgi:nitroimidazol reductase NimA-like FMN-containing flavoprotein (pyridoxamine 5'-phosphate oxidase superfamily)
MSPTAVLDARYSDPKAVAVAWDETQRILQSAELFWITTVRPDGRPHVTPLVAVWLDDAVHFHTGAREQKYVNLRANPHVVLTTGCSTWDTGEDVVVEGDAVPVTDPQLLARLAEAWAGKWDGRWQLAVRDGGFGDPESAERQSEVFTVAPSTIYAHAKGDPFGQTRYRL